MKNTAVSVDLGKNVIQECISANKKVRSNTEMAHHDFLEWLLRTKSTPRNFVPAIKRRMQTCDRCALSGFYGADFFRSFPFTWV
jgi:hypothetical protein